MKIKYDHETRKWFETHWAAETTVVQCKICGLFYKPKLGHKCQKPKEE